MWTHTFITAKIVYQWECDPVVSSVDPQCGCQPIVRSPPHLGLGLFKNFFNTLVNLNVDFACLPVASGPSVHGDVQQIP